MLPALLIAGVLLKLGTDTTHGLSRSEDIDLDRDIAQAQAFADGRFEDPFYRGEGVWYNPLVPALVAAVSRSVGQPVPATFVRLGAPANLLGPLAFYALVCRLFGATAATTATFGFVFFRDLPLATGVAVALVYCVPQYETRGYFGAAREGALRVVANEAEMSAFRWIRSHTHADDTFLAPPDLGLRLVGPAGRRTVVVPVLHSNPYVDWQSRQRLADSMLRALMGQDDRRFFELTGTAGVTYVLSAGGNYPWLEPLVKTGRLLSLVRCFEQRSPGHGVVRIYGVRRVARPCHGGES